MPYVANDIITITDVQDIDGEEVLNIYGYQITDVITPFSSEDILNSFLNLVVTDMLDLQANSLTHVELRVFNLTDGLTLGSLPVGLSGAETGTLIATNQLAYALKLNRSTAITRNGSKRIAGIPESSVQGNNLTSTALAELEDLADRMGSELDILDGLTELGHAIPVIIGRTATGEYDLTRINPISSVTALNRVTTQNSRKPF